ncbi:MAG: transcriptional regulator [Desulfobacterales bacterium]|nr:MAG: transcriptional regulator [Desulfobacterales bacterium]
MDKNSVKILVVDDEESILCVTESFFQKKGYEVYTACNGVEALKIINRIEINCIFTDIDMPIMGGLELAEQVHQIESSLPVVVMTGFPTLENSIQTLKNGVVDYLIKPVNLEQMELTLTRILKEREYVVENLILKEEIKRQKRLHQLNEELMHRIEEVNTLNRVMEDFSAINSSHDIYNKVVDLGVEELKADQSFFHIYSENDNCLVPVAASSRKEDDRTTLKSYGEDIPEQAKAFILASLLRDHSPCLITGAKSADIVGDPVRSFMSTPLKIRDKVFGVTSAYIFEDGRDFSEQDLYYMNFIAQKAAFAIENIALYENIYDNLFSTLFAFVTALEARDLYTHKHSARVSGYAQLIAEEMGCSEEELDVINVAGSLHDIGKIGIPDDILLKPGKLTSEEYETIKSHPVIGADIIGKLGLWNREKKIIRHHHERFDGKGYPDGLKGDQIPKLARVLSVADCYDAMASDRSYRKKMDKEVVVEIIRENSGTQFDPEIVEVFLRISDHGFF